MTKKYYNSYDDDVLPALLQAEENLKEKGAKYYTINLIGDLAQYALRARKTYNDIYKALAIFGIIVEELENES